MDDWFSKIASHPALQALAARMRPETLSRIGELAKYLLVV